MKRGSLLVLAVIGMIGPIGCDGGAAGGTDGGSDGDTDGDSDSDTDGDSDSDSDSDECGDLEWGEHGELAIGEVVQNWPFVGYADVDGDGAMELDHMVGFSMNRLHCAGYQSAVILVSSFG